MYIPTTKQLLLKEIHKLTDYTYKEINNKYIKDITKYPSRNKYYAKKYAINNLQGWLKTLYLKKQLG